MVKNFDGGGSQTTYFASNGTLLGYSDTWSDSGYSNTNYNDAEWNYLGGSFNDTANGFSGSYFSTTQKATQVLGGVDILSPTGLTILIIGILFTVGLPLTMILKGKKDCLDESTEMIRQLLKR